MLTAAVSQQCSRMKNAVRGLLPETVKCTSGAELMLTAVQWLPILAMTQAVYKLTREAGGQSGVFLLCGQLL